MFGGEHEFRAAAKLRKHKRYSGAFGDVRVTQNGEMVGIHREMATGSGVAVIMTRYEAMELAMKLARILEDK